MSKKPIVTIKEGERIPPLRGLIQLYIRRNASERIDTQWGNLSYIEWLRKEKKRIEAAKGRVAHIHVRGVVAALYVNKVA